MPAARNVFHPSVIRRFRDQLLSWYDANRRPLPWRQTKNPYHIWVSEIMLQQTRVAAVLEHYKRFLNRFPTTAVLAKADESDVLTEWSGLGYYRRARMLHRAAKVVEADHAGQVPASAQLLRELPGIGRYTANAIVSIAFDEAVAVVDGNVERVIARVTGKEVAGEELWTAAERLLDVDRPGDFNQAMMELGATVCVPAIPVCGRCPVMRFCTSRGASQKRTARPERVRRSASFLLVRRASQILLRRRSRHEQLMPDMWELPQSIRPLRAKPLLQIRHSITTTDWMVRVFSRPAVSQGREMKWISLNELSRLPLTGLTRKILMNLKLLT